MAGLTELESIIAEYNKAQKLLLQQAAEAEKKLRETELQFISAYNDVKNKEVKSQLSSIISCLNKAIGVQAKLNYFKKHPTGAGSYETVELVITRNNNNVLTIKISPNISNQKIIVSIDKDPGFGQDRKLEMILAELTAEWLNSFITDEFRLFISSS